ncbi:MAG TPA: hypothetical protein PKV67_17185 [Hyphomonas sp.]|nr:hypothetical protein [Hyphomonas sp.]HRJ02483.1 hypothetical protein [Hyphomonas sp.]HRK66405.1 hypothetical protein [Hyphomonas sp.]
MYGWKLPLAALGLMAVLAYPAWGQQAGDWDTPDISEFEEEDGASGDFDFGQDFVATDLSNVDKAHAAILKDADLQFIRPEAAPVELTPPDPPPPWLKAIGDFLNALGPVFRIIFWLAVAAVIAGLIYFLFGEAIRIRFGGRKAAKSKAEDDQLTDIRPDATAARSLLDDADALAREGKFAEAVHLLLYRSIEDIQTRLEGGVPTSLTSREIAGLGRLPERARRALAPIIQVVENSHFGGRAVDSGGWQHARRSYEEFAFGEGWGA